MLLLPLLLQLFPVAEYAKLLQQFCCLLTVCTSLLPGTCRHYLVRKAKKANTTMHACCCCHCCCSCASHLKCNPASIKLLPAHSLRFSPAINHTDHTLLTVLLPLQLQLFQLLDMLSCFNSSAACSLFALFSCQVQRVAAQEHRHWGF
jgi:hypothetical protein